MTDNAELLINSGYGKYIPQLFAEQYADTLGIELTDNDRAVLSDTEHSDYWEVWFDLIDNTTVMFNHTEHAIYHSEDVWLIPLSELENIEEA